MILSLKISSFVYENISSLSNSEKITFIVDFDENEDKKELDENEKIHQPIVSTNLNLFIEIKKNTSSISSEFRDLYFEYTTPPPELV